MSRERLRRRTGHGRGQSMTELAMLLPILAFLLLAVVDFAHVHSVQQRLENGAHLAALKLLANPSVSLAPDIAAEARLPSGAVTATTVYTADRNGDNHVTITAQYDDPLMLPGLRNLQTRALTNGKLRITVQATGLARTDPPTITNDLLPLLHCSLGSTYCLKIAPLTGTGPATPSGLSNLVCTVYRNGTPQQLQPGCDPSTPLYYGATGVSPGETFTATVTQADGIVSLPGTWSAP
jgi:Flp pilus assembly protein TadG